MNFIRERKQLHKENVKFYLRREFQLGNLEMISLSSYKWEFSVCTSASTWTESYYMYIHIHIKSDNRSGWIRIGSFPIVYIPTKRVKEPINIFVIPL